MRLRSYILINYGQQPPSPTKRIFPCERLSLEGDSSYPKSSNAPDLQEPPTADQSLLTYGYLHAIAEDLPSLRRSKTL